MGISGPKGGAGGRVLRWFSPQGPAWRPLGGPTRRSPVKINPLNSEGEEGVRIK